MNCLDCQEDLQRQLDEGQVPAAGPAVEEHLSICRDCRQLYAAARLLNDGVRLWEPVTVHPEFTDYLVEQILKDRLRRQSRRRLVSRFALAASILFAVAGVAFLLQPKPASPTPQPQLAQARSLSLQTSVEEAGTALVSLTRRTADETLNQTRMFLPSSLPETVLPTPKTPVQPLAVAGPALAEVTTATEGVAAGLEPVATSARRAFTLFLREMPTLEANSGM